MPVLVPAFVGLVWLLDGSPRIATAFWVGWWFGLGHFTAGLYWISNALLIDAAQFWWLVPFAALGLPAFLGLFIGGGTGAHPRLRQSRPVRAPPLLAAVWVTTEYVRGHILTGFPWNLIGYVWSDLPVMQQGAAYVGVYGLSLADRADRRRPGGADRRAARPGRGRRRRLALGARAFAAAAGGRGHGAADGASDATVPGVCCGLVQPDIAQSLKWRNDQLRSNFAKHIAMSNAPGPAPTAIDLVGSGLAVPARERSRGAQDGRRGRAAGRPC